ncbi:hypothetical protein K432DRAFT_447425 [Lepidopterella palustris CBS 459.81]|uniref:Rhodanese domain-containing protein n=1 Tax=Lepidopterella palustris CBS 459.81 TaxID=1314670 RepID=A0A8E2J9F2_9PEZI|nr:hypothetical protein K432DRAFT_447425 [Lepidopterella palustris CBS 459.81]
MNPPGAKPRGFQVRSPSAIPPKKPNTASSKAELADTSFDKELEETIADPKGSPIAGLGNPQRKLLTFRSDAQGNPQTTLHPANEVLAKFGVVVLYPTELMDFQTRFGFGHLAIIDLRENDATAQNQQIPDVLHFPLANQSAIDHGNIEFWESQTVRVGQCYPFNLIEKHKGVCFHCDFTQTRTPRVAQNYAQALGEARKQKVFVIMGGFMHYQRLAKDPGAGLQAIHKRKLIIDWDAKSPKDEPSYNKMYPQLSENLKLFQKEKAQKEKSQVGKSQNEKLSNENQMGYKFVTK